MFEIVSLKSFDAQFGKLARKAKKLGLPVPTYRVIKQEVREVDVYVNLRKAETNNVIVYTVEVNNVEPVKINGWSFVASLEPTHAGNLITATPYTECPIEYANTGTHCDHCKTKRDRSKLFVIKKGDEYKQVGSTCLKDFLGNNSPEKVADMFAFQGDIFTWLQEFSDDDLENYSGGGTRVYDLREYVALSIALQELYGFVSRSDESDRTSTADSMILDKGQTKISDDHYDLADKTIQYFLELPEEKKSETFFSNLYLLAKQGYFTFKFFGFVAAMYSCYKKSQEQETAAPSNSKHVGRKGERREFQALIKRIHVYETQFGIQKMTIMEDAEGNVLVGKDMKHRENSLIKFVATVDSHSYYRGIEQTRVLRAKNICLV